MQEFLRRSWRKINRRGPQAGSALLPGWVAQGSLASADEEPWRHPFLTHNNLARFRRYSEQVWQFAQEYAQRQARPLNCAFAVNMAQNMYKWARLAQKYGASVALFPDVEEKTVLSCPEWEEFDGEYADVLDGEGFLREFPGLEPEVPCYRIPRDGGDLSTAHQLFMKGREKPLLHLLAEAPGLRYESLLGYPGFYPYYRWARALSRYEVVYAANSPFPAYASGRPYCTVATGGDVRLACGRGDVVGNVLKLSFNGARFLMVSNPHMLGHSRRLGFTNGVYLPYPMDDTRYCPGEGQARMEWEATYGKGVYVMIPSRLDARIKGYDRGLFDALLKVAEARPQVRFVLLAWGEHVPHVEEMARSCSAPHQFVLLKPVGKKRLIDYYRSCDVVLDQLVYGYYGATALEAAAVGKPVVMRLRPEHYAPLYQGDVAPVVNADSPGAVGDALITLIEDGNLRARKGREMREWLVRNHGEERTIPLLLALLRVAADQAPLPEDLVSPLLDPESKGETDYHASCRKVTP